MTSSEKSHFSKESALTRVMPTGHPSVLISLSSFASRLDEIAAIVDGERRCCMARQRALRLEACRNAYGPAAAKHAQTSAAIKAGSFFLEFSMSVSPL